MEISGTIFLFTIFLVFLVAVVLVFAGLKKQPGLGIITAVIIIAIQMIAQKRPLSEIGFSAPENWIQTIFLGLILGIIIQIFSVTLIEPLTEKITGEKHDHSILDAVRGNWKVYLQWVVMVWLLVAILEEGVFRGYFITELTNLFGKGILSIIVVVILSSLVFGLSHGYQNKCGILSTGIVGIVLGIIFVLSEFNLWLVIFTHGFIDTVGIGLIAIGFEDKIKIHL